MHLAIRASRPLVGCSRGQGYLWLNGRHRVAPKARTLWGRAGRAWLGAGLGGVHAELRAADAHGMISALPSVVSEPSR